jgi:hypothetical protein
MGFIHKMVARLSQSTGGSEMSIAAGEEINGINRQSQT